MGRGRFVEDSYRAHGATIRRPATISKRGCHPGPRFAGVA
jgi:hypothetical protein